MPGATPAALDLMASLCAWDPARRPTAAQALAHPYFQVRATAAAAAATQRLRPAASPPHR